MNPTTPKAHRITAEGPPQFPCWLWSPEHDWWFKATAVWADPEMDFLGRHKIEWWHPDQPTAPSSIPSPVSSQEGRTGGLLAEMGEHYAQKQDRQDSEGAGAKENPRLSWPDIPAHLIRAAYDIDEWMQRNGHEGYCLGPICERRHFAQSQPNQPAQEAALRLRDRIAMHEGLPDFDVEQLGIVLNLIRSELCHFPSLPVPSPAAVGEVREALQRVVDAYYSNKASMPTPIIEHCERALSKPSTPTQSQQPPLSPGSGEAHEPMLTTLEKLAHIPLPGISTGEWSDFVNAILALAKPPSRLTPNIIGVIPQDEG